MMWPMVKRVYYAIAYWLSWIVFGSVGTLVSIVCLPLLLFPRTDGMARRMRATIQRLFRIYMVWFRGTDTLRIKWEGFDQPLTSRTVYIANHPTLLDAPVLLSRLPDAICVLKSKLMRNPATGPAAILAGYASGSGGVDTVRDTAARVVQGCSLLIFPEGTRTDPSQSLGPLQAGFTLIAARAKAPVQLVVIRATRGVTTRGRAWWKLPHELPAKMTLRMDRRWEPSETLSATRLAREIEKRMRAVLPAESHENPGPV